MTLRPLVPVWIALSLSLSCHSPGAGAGAGAGAQESFADTLEGTRALAGLLDLHVADDAGRIWLTLPPADGEAPRLRLLYAEGLTTGLGSNPVGLDRGQLGPARVISFRVVGDRVLVEAENLAFRAESADPHERRAARESFASSVLWAGDVAARATRRGARSSRSPRFSCGTRTRCARPSPRPAREAGAWTPGGRRSTPRRASPFPTTSSWRRS